MQTIAERQSKSERLATARAGGPTGVNQSCTPCAIPADPHPLCHPAFAPLNCASFTLAGELPPLIGDYQVLHALGSWVAAAITPVTTRVLLEYRGVRLVSMEEWGRFQTSLLLLFLGPLAMAPTRESILVHLRHPNFFQDPCGQCTNRGCKGSRIERVPNSRTWALRAGHHKTDETAGILVCPIPEGLAALVGLWAYSSQLYTGRMPQVHTLFYSFHTGEAFTEGTLSSHMVSTLRGIMERAGLPSTTPRGLRHIFAAGYSDFAAAHGGERRQLRELQDRAAVLMGTSRNKFKVSRTECEFWRGGLGPKYNLQKNNLKIDWVGPVSPLPAAGHL